MGVVVAEKRVRTTVSLPETLVEALDDFIRSERRLFPTRTDFLESAVRQHLAHLERLRIDQEFAEMAFDERYLVAASRIADEFEGAETPLD